MDNLEEKQLIIRAQKNPEVFGEIFDKYYDQIYGYILRRVGNVYISQDIASDVFLKAMDRLWQFKWKGISISSWLYRIASNEINQYYRNNKRSFFSLDDLIAKRGFDFTDDNTNILEEIINQERELARKEEWQKARQRIEKLPLKYQEVIALRYFENKKILEISEILDKKEGTIKSLLSRGLEKLRDMQPKVG